VDVTPFVGGSSTATPTTWRSPFQNNGDSWSVVATLLLYTDHGLAQTHGALTTDTVAPAATEHVTKHGRGQRHARRRHDLA